MKVLVSGANGFIGSNLCAHLSSKGYSVVPVVRRPSGIKGEIIIKSAAMWPSVLDGCSSVVHLAGLAQADRFQKSEPISREVFWASNVHSAEEIANRAVESGVQRFILMSTIKVNGEKTSPGVSFKPDDPPAPKNLYAISKLEAENRLLEISKSSGLEAVIVRSPVVYGQRPKGNFASLIRWVKSGVPLPLGAITNRRSMIAIENIASFLELCADIKSSPKASGQIFLVSDGEDISTSELLRRVAKAYGVNSRLFPVPAELLWFAMRSIGRSSIADRLLGSLVVDWSKASEMLNWKPPVTMDEQLKKMVLNDSCF